MELKHLGVGVHENVKGPGTASAIGPWWALHPASTLVLCGSNLTWDWGGGRQRWDSLS